MGPQRVTVNDIDGAAKHFGDVAFDTRIIIDCSHNLGIEIDEDIDVATRALLVTRDGTEQGGVSDAMRPQVSLALLQRPDDVVSFHAAFIPQQPRKFDGQIMPYMEWICGTEKPKYINNKARLQAHWSARVHEEWTTALLRNRPDITRMQLEQTGSLMDTHIQDALVEGFEHRIDALTLPDADDRHLLAAVSDLNVNPVEDTGHHRSIRWPCSSSVTGVTSRSGILR
jgi:hypothetical protein